MDRLAAVYINLAWQSMGRFAPGGSRQTTEGWLHAAFPSGSLAWSDRPGRAHEAVAPVTGHL
jgi:hypothetical protein